MNGKLTLEAWVRLDTDESSPGTVVQLGAGSRRLVLAAGGKDGEVALTLVVGDTTTRLCSAKGLVKKGQWAHVAATARLDDTGLAIDSQVYFQGTARAKGKTALDPAKPAQFTALQTLLSSPVVSQCSLGGAAPGLARLRGGLAEVRIWRGVKPERLAQLWLTRVRGDENGLLACWRLDAVTDGLFHDHGPRSGWGHAAAGVTLADTNGPPLPTTAGAPYRLKTRGKLVRETVAGPKVSTKMLGSQPKQLYGTTLVYDATVEVTTPAGDGASDRSLEVRIDRPLSAFVGPTEKGELKPWKADETQVVSLNGAGKVRLRFLADDLGCPTIRVRVAGAAGGVWTAIRPDAPVQQRLRTIKRDDLTNPAPGRRNPLPAGTSSDDASALADAFRYLATQFPAAPQAPAQAQATPQTKPNLKPTPGASSVTSATRSRTAGTRPPAPSRTPSTRAPTPSRTA
ncbi:LamG-like jellyroll fold domain-containing protein [Nannocystis pusilla]|uniref:LamG-like jellyroll fold domain-containing protein n=1 Tax=Nannocystis pusilla TaxID=889268 RepID=UPI003B7EB393